MHVAIGLYSVHSFCIVNLQFLVVATVAERDTSKVVQMGDVRLCCKHLTSHVWQACQQMLQLLLEEEPSAVLQ